jgi:hypothetical protein
MARGEAGPDSDIDLLVVVDDDATAEKPTLKAGFEAHRSYTKAADVFSDVGRRLRAQPHYYRYARGGGRGRRDRCLRPADGAAVDENPGPECALGPP